MAQGEGSKFKPQYPQKKERKKDLLDVEMPKVPTELNRKKREQRGRKKGPNLTGDI
jgi:hypothetical protein